MNEEKIYNCRIQIGEVNLHPKTKLPQEVQDRVVGKKLITIDRFGKGIWKEISFVEGEEGFERLEHLVNFIKEYE